MFVFGFLLASQVEQSWFTNVGKLWIWTLLISKPYEVNSTVTHRGKNHHRELEPIILLSGRQQKPEQQGRERGGEGKKETAFETWRIIFFDAARGPRTRVSRVP